MPLTHEHGGVRRSFLAACPYFAVERVEVQDTAVCLTHGDSFHIVLAVEGSLRVEEIGLEPGQALIVPAELSSFTLSGSGAFLDYYIPDVARDIRQPLFKAGHSEAAVDAFTATR